MGFVNLFGAFFCMGTILSSCNSRNNINNIEKKELAEEVSVECKETDSLIILYPDCSSINLVCDSMPSEKDESVLLVAAACFTGQCLKEFNHFNIAGDHVSSGVRYHGYPCKRNTGAFIYHDRKWKFLYGNYSTEMDAAAQKGGAAFAQEMIMHKSRLVKTKRSDSNRNQFRALCQIGEKLCIIESKVALEFGVFKQLLMKHHVQEALYLDMGEGWNHAWYRVSGDSIVELHPKTHPYCTNWITFYK